jgi:hypothetical protein
VEARPECAAAVALLAAADAVVAAVPRPVGASSGPARRW